MDDILRAEFPVGDQGYTVTVKEPTEGQVMVLASSTRQTPRSDSAMRSINKIVRVAESLMGPEQWADIEDEMIDGSLSVGDFLSLIQDVLSFDWSAHKKKSPGTAPGSAGTRAPRIIQGG